MGIPDKESTQSPLQPEPDADSWSTQRLADTRPVPMPTPEADDATNDTGGDSDDATTGTTSPAPARPEDDRPDHR